jgi:hypothetical protein
MGVLYVRVAGAWVPISSGGVPTTRLISTTAPLAGGGDLSADRTLTVANFTSTVAGTAPASGGGTANYLRADGTWVAPPAITTTWTALSLNTNWSYFGAPWATPAYRKNGDVVEVRGLIACSASQSTSVGAATLPAGFRPPSDQMFPCLCNVAAGVKTNTRVDVTAGGSLNYWAPSTGVVTYLSLDTIRFSVT